MSASGTAYPAEMFPRKVSRAGVDFQLGATTDGAKDEEVIVQITGYGPSSTTPIAPAEGAFGAPHRLR